MKQIFLPLLLLSLHAQASFDVSGQYQSWGVKLGQKIGKKKICGAQSSVLGSTPLADKDVVANCKPIKGVEALMVSHRDGVPLQVSMQFEGGPEIDPMLTNGPVVLSDSTDSTGVRTVKGLLATDAQKKFDKNNQSAFTILASAGKVSSFTITNCETDFAEKRAKGQFESCQKGLPSAK